MLKRFHFDRLKDASGVSGTGRVAEGCFFTDTKECVVHWFGAHSSINVYHSIEDVIFLHGHQGSTLLIWDDPLDETPSKEELKKDGN